MKLSSPVFNNGEMIPSKYTCDGEDINPPLIIDDIPPGTQSLALIVEDPDAIRGVWVHWVVYDITPRARIEENSVPGKTAQNDFGRSEYGGPCPPSGTHRYYFRLFALDTMFDLPDGAGAQVLKEREEGHVLDKAELMGVYIRRRNRNISGASTQAGSHSGQRRS
jgi:Raf kinase inhibitor-like YbhB/YbcL family protein